MLIIKALNFAAKKHLGQERRESGLPYVIHPVIVMHLLDKYKTSKHIEELKCAALLHDTLEDTECSYIEIEREFGPLVASIVIELTSDEVKIKEIGKNEYLKQKMLLMSKYSFTVKLVDRLANILDNPKEKYLQDTRNLMDFLTDNREELTNTQKDIMIEIYSILNKKEKTQ